MAPFIADPYEGHIITVGWMVAALADGQSRLNLPAGTSWAKQVIAEALAAPHVLPEAAGDAR